MRKMFMIIKRHKKLKIAVYAFAVFMLFTAGLIEPACAADKAAARKEETVTVKKSIVGEASGVSGNFIAVVYGLNEKEKSSLEMAFDIDKSVEIVHKRKISEINAGDIVQVDYDEILKTDEAGKKSSKRVAKFVTFLRAAAKVQETEGEAGGLLKSNDESAPK